MVNQLGWLVQKTHAFNLFPRNWLLSKATGNLCRLAPHICEKVEDGFFDWNDAIDNAARYGDKAAHGPSGSGWRNLIHYGQIVKAKKFVRYDYG